MDKLAWYYALNGLNILLLIGRVLKLMDFQPRLGVVTRSLALAGPDLIHFCLVCGMVFVGYAMMGHLILGPYIQVGSDAVGCAERAQAGGVCGLSPVMQRAFLAPLHICQPLAAFTVCASGCQATAWVNCSCLSLTSPRDFA